MVNEVEQLNNEDAQVTIDLDAFYPQNDAVYTLDLKGCTYIPVGYYLYYLEEGYLGYDFMRADSSLTTSRVIVFMKRYFAGEDVSRVHTIIWKDGELTETNVDSPSVCQVYIGNKFIGILGHDVPLQQELRTLLKLGRKAGFYPIINDEGGDTDIEREITHQYDSNSNYDRDEMTQSR